MRIIKGKVANSEAVWYAPDTAISAYLTLLDAALIPFISQGFANLD